jgi:hypothetical protein
MNPLRSPRLTRPQRSTPVFNVNDRLESLAGQLYVKQRPYIDDIVDLAMKGSEEVQNKIKTDVLSKIKDSVQRESMENAIKKYADPKHALLNEVEKALKGTASEDRFTPSELLKALHHWLPGGEIGMGIRNLQNSGSGISSLDPPVASSRWDSPPEQIILSPTDQVDNISAIDATTNAARTSGFMYDDDCSPTELARAHQQIQRETGGRDPAASADLILTRLRKGFVDHYLAIMFGKALETVTSQIGRTAQGCLDDLGRLATERHRFFEERRQQRGKMDAGTRRTQTLEQMLAWGNIVAGLKAMEVLQAELNAIAQTDF